MRKIICLCFILSAQVFAQNTGKISGVVLDAKTKESIPSVNVLVRGTSLGAVTDLEGKYFILNIPPGEYDVAASMVGYQGVVQQKVIVSVNRTTSVDYSLKEEAILGEEVIIMAIRPDVEREKTSTSEIVRGEEVLSVPGIQDIQDVLSLTSDVSDGHFRGGRENQELYNLHGLGIMNPLNSGAAFNPIMSAVEQVEVITSGFSAQYGNAQSGIVNITMKEGRTDRWAGRAEMRSRLPGRKHFGPSVWDPSANPYMNRLNSPEKWRGADSSTGGSVFYGSIGNGFDGRYAKDSITLSQITYAIWLQQGRRNYGLDYDNLMDYSVDANVGGPLSNSARLFLAIHSNTSWGMLPTPDPNVSRQVMGNIVQDVGDGMTMRFSGAWSHATSTYLSGSRSTGWYSWIWDLALGTTRTQDDNLQYGLRWTHALSQSTFYEVKLNVLSTKSTDGSPVTNPEGHSLAYLWDSYGAVPDGFQYANMPDDFVSEKSRTISLEATFTSQVLSSHLLLAGIQANWYAIDVNNLSGLMSSTDWGNYIRYSAKPYEGALFVQDKLEFQGMIANIGLRLDFYNYNYFYYEDQYSPYRYVLDSLTYYNPTKAPKAKTSLVARLQPRVGFSFPVSENTVFHANYGTFVQRPPFNQVIYSTMKRKEILDNGMASTVGTIGNARLRPEVTNSYDVGLTLGMGEGFTLDVSGYYKDVRDLLQRAVLISSTLACTTYVNRDYADIRGFRIGIAKRRGILTGTMNYTYGVATGKNSSFDGDSPIFDEQGTGTKMPSPKDIFMEFDRTHNLVANVGFNSPENWGFEFFGICPLERLTIAVTSTVRSGLPYSSRIDRSELMNRRTPNEYNTNLKITKQIPGFFGTTATVYAEVFNLFDQRIYNYSALFATSTSTTTGPIIDKYAKKYELGEDITYYEDDLRPGFLINQEFRIFNNAPRSVNVGMIINL